MSASTMSNHAPPQVVQYVGPIDRWSGICKVYRAKTPDGKIVAVKVARGMTATRCLIGTLMIQKDLPLLVFYPGLNITERLQFKLENKMCGWIIARRDYRYKYLEIYQFSVFEKRLVLLQSIFNH